MIIYERRAMLSETVQGDWLFGKSSSLMLDELDGVRGFSTLELTCWPTSVD